MRFRLIVWAVIFGIAALSHSDAAPSEALFRDAVEKFSAQNFEASAAMLKTVTKQRPNWFDAQFLLGASLAGTGNHEDAVVSLQKAHALRPAHLDCAKLLASEYLALARATSALQILRPLVVVSNKPDEELFLLTIQALHIRGDAGDSAQAMALVTRGLKRYPGSQRMLVWRGYALREQSDFEGARRSLESALAIDPDDATAKVILADAMRMSGDLEKALRLFDEVLAANPSDLDALLGKGRALRATGRNAEAVETLSAAVRLTPDSPRLRLSLSQAYATLGDRDSAAREASEYRRLSSQAAEPNLPDALRSLK